MMRLFPGQTGRLVWVWAGGVPGQAEARAVQLQRSSGEGQARQPQLKSRSCAKGRAAAESSSSFLLKSSSRLAKASQGWPLPHKAGLERVAVPTVTGKSGLSVLYNGDEKICSFY